MSRLDNTYQVHRDPDWKPKSQYMINYYCVICKKWGVTIHPQDDPELPFGYWRCAGCMKTTMMLREKK